MTTSVDPGSLSVVVAAHNADSTIGACIGSIRAQAPPPSEVVVVVDGACHKTAAEARAGGASVLALPHRSGPGAARNAGVAVAAAEFIAFVDADDVVAPGWATAVRAAFAAGADLVDYELLHVERADVVSRYLGGRRGSQPAWTPPWPGALSVNGGWFAVRRSVFEQLGGFDPDLRGSEDHDFLARAALAGHRRVVALGAGYDYRHRRSVASMIRQRAAWAYWRVVLRAKYEQFPFLFPPDRRIVRRAATSSAVALMRSLTGERKGASIELLDAVSLFAEGAGGTMARLDLALGRRRPVPLAPAGAVDAEAGGGLPPGPRALLVGDEGAVAAVASAMRVDPRVGSPPAGLWPTSAAAWDAPAAAPADAVDAANRLGWALPKHLATRRLAAARVATEGESLLALHGIHAWLGRKGSWIAAAGGAAGPVAAAFLPSVPLVAIGAVGDVDRPPVLSISPAELRRNPAAVVHRLAPVLGLVAPERAGVTLRAVLLLRGLRRRAPGSRSAPRASA